METLKYLWAISTVLLGAIFWLTITSDDLVFIGTHEVSTPIEIETSDVGDVDAKQTISFTNENGEYVVIENALFDGVSNAQKLYVYRVGKYEIHESIPCKSYCYFVTDNEVKQ